MGPEPVYEITEEDLLRMRFVERLKIKQIAAHYGCSVRTVNKRLKQFGLFKNRTHNLDGEELARLYNGGVTFRDLSEKFDAPYYTIWLALEGTSAEKRGSHRRVGTFIGKDNPIWQGGVNIHPGGYIRVRIDGREQILHRMIVEDMIGRPLLSSEIVHHVDVNPLNDVPSNLLVCESNSEHMKLHAAMRKNSNLDQREWLRNYRGGRKVEPEWPIRFAA